MRALKNVRMKRANSARIPGKSEGLGQRDGVRASALAHAVQLVQRDVQTEEELQGVFGDGCGPCVALGAAIQSQSLAHLFEHKLFGNVVAEGWTSCCVAPMYKTGRGSNET